MGITMNSPNNSSDLDPMPTWLLKKCIDGLLPLITAATDKSIIESSMPRCLKRATVMLGLVKEDMKNCWPMSKTSKLLVISTPMKEHDQNNDFHHLLTYRTSVLIGICSFTASQLSSFNTAVMWPCFRHPVIICAAIFWIRCTFVINLDKMLRRTEFQ